jgi:predicted N-acetyltransferase YhbS
MITIVPQRPADAPIIEQLLDDAFEPERRLRPAYSLRGNATPLDTLSFVARAGGRLVGTIDFWPVTIGRTTSALLLGPLAVVESFRRRGVAAALVGHGLDAARDQGHRIVVVIGEAPVFARFGFVAALDRGLTMPVPVEPARFMAYTLTPGALDGISGVLGSAVVAGAPPVRALRRAI